MIQRNLSFLLLCLAGILLTACVEQLDLNLPGTVDVIVVDGTITNLAEPQTIRLNRSRADPFTGRFGTLPLTNVILEVVVDSAEFIGCHETVDGSYQLPSDFRAQVGHAYQLRFQLPDGRRYASTQQIMQAVAPIEKLRVVFNQNSLPGKQFAEIRAAHDIYLTSQDPAQTRNFYRWDWTLYERQSWCRTCVQSVYAPNNVIIRPGPPLILIRGTEVFEDCYAPPFSSSVPLLPDFRYDYECKTQCWEIIRNSNLNLFSDALSNGGTITNRLVAQIPFFQYTPCLAVIRQVSLTADAFRYFSLFEQQTQNTGGLADTPPTALVGNVTNTAKSQENVIGYFTVAAVAQKSVWIDRKDTQGTPPGLFQALNGRDPIPEPLPPNEPYFPIIGNPRPPLAVCVQSDTRTPIKPEGWQE